MILAAVHAIISQSLLFCSKAIQFPLKYQSTTLKAKSRFLSLVSNNSFVKGEDESLKTQFTLRMNKLRPLYLEHFRCSRHLFCPTLSALRFKVFYRSFVVLTGVIKRTKLLSFFKVTQSENVLFSLICRVDA